MVAHLQNTSIWGKSQEDQKFKVILNYTTKLPWDPVSIKTNKQTKTVNPVTIESLCNYFPALNKPDEIYITASYAIRKHIREAKMETKLERDQLAMKPPLKAGKTQGWMPA